MTLKLVETVGSTYSPTEYEKGADGKFSLTDATDAAGNVIKNADGSVVKVNVVKTAAHAKRLYGYGASNPNQIVNADVAKNLDKGGDPLKQTAIVQNANDGQKPVNPVAEGIKPAADPKGTFIEEYKGYKIFQKLNLPNYYLETRLGDGDAVHKGFESRNEAEKVILINFEKKFIDDITSK